MFTSVNMEERWMSIKSNLFFSKIVQANLVKFFFFKFALNSFQLTLFTISKLNTWIAKFVFYILFIEVNLVKGSRNRLLDLTSAGRNKKAIYSVKKQRESSTRKIYEVIGRSSRGRKSSWKTFISCTKSVYPFPRSVYNAAAAPSVCAICLATGSRSSLSPFLSPPLARSRSPLEI